MRRLMLLDTASLYFRAFYGVPASVTAADGTPVNAVRGLLDTITYLVTTYRPDGLIACWDEDWRPAFRVAAIPSYKAHRVEREGEGGPDVEQIPADLLVQVPVIVDVLASVGIARMGSAGYEADDVIGSLVAREQQAGVRGVDIVSGDRDMFQLVDDASGVRVLYPAKGIRGMESVDQGWLSERYGLGSGRAYADMAILRGDPSDGLPGVVGVGEKTAVALIGRYGNLAGIESAANTDDPGMTAAQRRKILASAAYLAVAPDVVNVVRDVPLPDVDDSVPRGPRDPAALAALIDRWNLGSAGDRLVAALAG